MITSFGHRDKRDWVELDNQDRVGRARRSVYNERQYHTGPTVQPGSAQAVQLPFLMQAALGGARASNELSQIADGLEG